jgi:hypothetical protein
VPRDAHDPGQSVSVTTGCHGYPRAWRSCLRCGADRDRTGVARAGGPAPRRSAARGRPWAAVR